MLLGRSSTAWLAGDIDVALASAEEAVAVLSGFQDSWPALWANYALAAARIESGQAERAEAVLGALLADDGRNNALGVVEALELLTRARLGRGDHDGAAEAAVRAEQAADRFGLEAPRARAARAAAEVALATGDPEAAAERALRSAAGFGELGAPLEEARSRLVAGRALAPAGDPKRAAEELSAAAAAFERCGAIPRRDEAERELRRIGHKKLHRRTRPGQADAAGVDALTERELQVARLIVDRRTNPEIAAELFLSTKTVESHVRNLFQKLGVSSRVEVARAVERADRATPAP